jgi:hypothetical protein
MGSGFQLRQCLTTQLKTVSDTEHNCVQAGCGSVHHIGWYIPFILFFYGAPVLLQLSPQTFA